MKINEVVILAGGLGSRLRGVLPDLPKPLAPVNGKPFIFYILDFWFNQGITKFILAIGYKHDLIINEIRESKFSDFVEFSIEEELLDTGGAILKCLSQIKGNNFIVQNGDTYIPIKLKSLLKKYKELSYKTIFIATVAGEDENRYKLLTIDKSGLITEDFNLEGKRGINSGLYILNKLKILKIGYAREEKISFEKVILNDLIIKKECTGAFFNSPFLDIGIPQDYNKAQFLLKDA